MQQAVALDIIRKNPNIFIVIYFTEYFIIRVCSDIKEGYVAALVFYLVLCIE